MWTFIRTVTWDGLDSTLFRGSGGGGGSDDDDDDDNYEYVIRILKFCTGNRSSNILNEMVEAHCK